MRAFLLLTFVLTCASLAASPVSAQPAPPALTSTVNDFAKVVDEASTRELDRRIRALQHESGDVIVVANVPSIEV